MAPYTVPFFQIFLLYSSSRLRIDGAQFLNDRFNKLKEQIFITDRNRRRLLFKSPRTQGPLYGCAAAHTHFSPGAAKARKMTFFLGKIFQSRGGIREKNVGGGARKGFAHSSKVPRAGPART